VEDRVDQRGSPEAGGTTTNRDGGELIGLTGEPVRPVGGANPQADLVIAAAAA
jgi:hypothetical protein